ncbi:hypothetical protein EV361DRAFT_919790 [Lentinula raphanica]|uniref:Uncharacterized protein n=1 Tax=Lentinula raphanica TaxID=153919 RepID=A0AA38UBW2_9AGAR|nr:hypothetical protein F5880DRAFT_1571495 [Lentinula raphanica]KAJ3836742.1 hypothetical protein F5878DRAFT_624361 [Lentinula raphanica]KAJ3969649.1 hypothetical protein EV361DRAFT_919790 [Lentinula raphanica]
MSDDIHTLPRPPYVTRSETEDSGEYPFIDLTALTRRLEQVERMPSELPRYTQVEDDAFPALNAESFKNSACFPPCSKQLAPVWTTRQTEMQSVMVSYNLRLRYENAQYERNPSTLQVGTDTALSSLHSSSFYSPFSHVSSQDIFILEPASAWYHASPSGHPVLSRHSPKENTLRFHDSLSLRTSKIYYSSLRLQDTRMRRIVNVQTIRCPISQCTAVITTYVEDIRRHLICDHTRFYSLPLESSMNDHLICDCGYCIYGGGEGITAHISAVHTAGPKIVACTNCDWEGLVSEFPDHLLLCEGLFLKHGFFLDG